ncbi:hypothetical protein PROFUN_00375 [Planoprotostelium fungivorum]|uniref:Homeobox domain-containing protein n=1 Tax=Planoprotostelium fungivorum TaxID=1890364 RepID=A0A2P6NY71_9EUKA|nr:hypothetical protein PROFUN_00375 [Planoprotostelium fungivorum]
MINERGAPNTLTLPMQYPSSVIILLQFDPFAPLLRSGAPNLGVRFKKRRWQLFFEEESTRNHFPATEAHHMDISKILTNHHELPFQHLCQDKQRVFFFCNSQREQTKDGDLGSRRSFSMAQKEEMLRIYSVKPYPTQKEREEIARIMDTTQRRVQVWFQNHRARAHLRRSDI